MAREGLNSARVAALAKAGRRGLWGDGGGLYLRTDPNRASWIYRYKVAGRERQMGLGEFSPSEGKPGLTLAQARLEAARWRTVLREGRDPIAERDAHREKMRREADTGRAAASTFRAVADAMITSREAEWRNAKHRAQWRSTLATYAYPIIGDLPVADVAGADVLRVLQPIWTAKPETAARLRGRIERVLAYARTIGLRTGDNPAVWRGHLAEALPSPAKVKRLAGSGHHPALPWREAGDFLAELRKRDGTAARALEFLILTAARTGEVLGMRWSEVDMGAKVWTVSADRMKAGREHRVPLSEPAMALLRAVAPRDGTAPPPATFVFSGALPKQPLSSMALLMLLRRMNPELPDAPPGEKHRWRDGKTGEAITSHGFRSTFRDWCAEATTTPREVAEAALAHVLKDRVEAAYMRADLLERRRPLMDDWARFLSAPMETGTVIPLQQVRAAAHVGG